MNEMNYLHQNKTDSLFLEKNVERKALGTHQQENFVLNQTADVQQLLKSKEEQVSYLCSSSLDQHDPEHVHIKKEEEEDYWSREGAKLPLKSEDDEKPQLLQVHQIKTEDNRETEPSTSSSAEQMKTETNGEDCEGLEFGPTESQVKSKSDVQLLLKVKEEEVPHLWSFSLAQQGQEPFHIKEELSETTERDCEGTELQKNHDLNTYLRLNSDKKASDSSDTENSDDYGEDGVTNMSGSETKTKQSDEDWWETRTSGSQVKRNVGHKGVKRSFSCSQCRKQFVNKRALQKHITSHSGESSSSLVDKKYSKKKQTRADSVAKRFACVDCGRAFKSQDDLKSHMARHTGTKLFSCDKCDKTFNYKHNLKCHMRLHTGEKPFACDKCDKTYHYRHYLNYHMSCHMEEKPFSCDECGKRFYDKYYLKYHRRLHTGEKPFACDKCGKTFYFSHNLKLHMMQHAGMKFPCDKCGKTFTHLITLNRHLKRHTKKERFQCEVCDKLLSTKGSLKRHMALHTGNRPFACSNCQKRFICSRDLNRHMICHLKVKPFVCIECCAGFSREESLRKHYTLHTGNEPYVCDKCNKKFVSKAYFEKHKAVHLSGKKISTKKGHFSCKECGETFNKTAQLTAHRYIHTGVKPFRCDVCSAGFTRQSALKQHVLKFHKK